MSNTFNLTIIWTSCVLSEISYIYNNLHSFIYSVYEYECLLIINGFPIFLSTGYYKLLWSSVGSLIPSVMGQEKKTTNEITRLALLANDYLTGKSKYSKHYNLGQFRLRKQVHS